VIHISIDASSAAEIRAHLATLYSAFCGSVQPVAAPAEPEQPKPARTRTKKAETTEPAAAVETQQAAAPAASSESLFGTTEAVTPAPAVKQPEQKDLIAAMRALNDKKGTDAIVAMLGKYGAKTVALIPKDKWSEAINEAHKQAA
jgi:hypothetical protein